MLAETWEVTFASMANPSNQSLSNQSLSNQSETLQELKCV